MTFDNSFVSIWTYAPGNYRILVKHKPRLAYQLNSVLKEYDIWSVFTAADEVPFKFNDAQIELIKQGSRQIGKILAQLQKGLS